MTVGALAGAWARSTQVEHGASLLEWIVARSSVCERCCSSRERFCSSWITSSCSSVDVWVTAACCSKEA